MQGPTRIAYAGKPHAAPAVVAGTAAVALMFAATPFLIAAVAGRFGVSEGAVGFISLTQVGAFALANFVLPRLLAPSGRILRAAAAALVVLNLSSVVPSAYGALVVLRLVAGFAAGTMTWVAWTDAMQERTSMAAVAATGPTAMLIGAPVLSVVATHGDQAVYLLLGVTAIPAALLSGSVTGSKRQRGAVSASRSNRVLLAALWGVTFFGSALFINLSLVARDLHDLTAPAASLGFSLNAAGGLLGARLSIRHRRPGLWLISAGAAAFITVTANPVLFFIGMTWWGFAFWMAIPGVLQMLSERSLRADERAGDAQGLMAFGRALGPALGGLFVDAGSLVGLAQVAAGGLAISGATVVGVQEGRDRLPPTKPRTGR